MSALPEVNNLVSLLDQAVADHHVEAPRPHLGASQIGKSCDRALWYGFRWVHTVPHSGRMLRLFNRGHEEEARFERWLTLAGITVFTIDERTGQQFQFADMDTGGHFGGSMDGMADGIPEAPKTRHVLEFKTHSNKSFNALVKNGVHKAKPEHDAQMQVYMHRAGLTRALYLAVNKNDDHLYAERVAYDAGSAQQLLARAKRIVTAQEPPAKLSETPDWYECTYCDYRTLCHGSALPDVHCRTCLHSTPELDGNARWSCAKWQADIPVEGQREGCGEHRYIPALIPWAAVVDATDEGDVIYELKDGSHRPLVNGVGGLSSAQLQQFDPEQLTTDYVDDLPFDDDIPF